MSVVKTPKRAKFTKEFKVEACKLVTEQGLRVKDAASNLGVPEPLLGRWVREYRGSGRNAFPGEGKLPDSDSKIRELEAKVRRLTLEREILKKAMAYFVEPSK